MGKDFWKTFFRLNWKYRWIGKSGALGDDAQQAADEVDEDLDPIMLIVFVIGIVGLVLWLIFG